MTPDEPDARSRPPRSWTGRARDVSERVWRRLHHHGAGRWLILGGAVGALTGAAGFVFAVGTDLLARWALGSLIGYTPVGMHGISEARGDSVRIWA
ncbi:MAG: hypothetical protein H0X45_10910, partial [Planctomycetes bacterium]|nr:hypothetical protein [Planctomycetota bacterium]